MKKCPYCAEEIQDEAIFCRYCKHDLPAQLIQPPQQIYMSQNKGTGNQKQLKKVWLALLLNCIIIVMGLGYIYIGKTNKFAIIFLIQLFSLWPMTVMGLRNLNGYLLFILWIYTMFDIYFATVKYNDQLTDINS